MMRIIVFWTLLLFSQLKAHPIELEDYLNSLQNQLNRQKRSLPVFDAALQRVENTGEHAFVPPGPNDKRGPCPALNTMANHNYLPRNGVATTRQFTQACFEVFGMGLDLSIILAIYGGITSGNFAEWSIGGPSKLVQFPGILGQPQGIANSHNIYENDASATRGDLYLYGDSSVLQLSIFKELLALKNGTNATYDVSTVNTHENNRINECINNNPYCFFGPVSGLAVQSGAHRFIPRMMANHSEEWGPEGVLDREVLMSFYGVQGDDLDNLTYLVGHERIPDNWYKRPVGYEYTLAFFFADLIEAAAEYPNIIKIGGNTGKVNTFTGVDLGNMTGGAFNLATLLEGDNLQCFIVQFLLVAVPDTLKGAVGSLASILLSLVSKATGSSSSIACPQLQYNPDVFSIYPGCYQVDAGRNLLWSLNNYIAR